MAAIYSLTSFRISAGKPFIGAMLMLMLGLCQPLPVAAQSTLSAINKQAKESTSATVQPALPAGTDELKKQLAEAQAELAAIDSPERLASGAPPGTPTAQLQERVRALRLLVFSLRQHINAIGNLAELTKISTDAEAVRKAWSGLSEKPPYSVLFVDGMRAELQAGLLDLRSEEIRLKILVAQTENAKEAFQKAGERQRLAQDALESAKPGNLPAATWRHSLAALEVRAQGAFLESLSAIGRTVKASIAEYDHSVEFIRLKLGEVDKSVSFKPEDFERLKSDIDERRAMAINALEHAARERERLSIEVDKAMENHTAAGKAVLDLQTRMTEMQKLLAAAEAEVAKAEKPTGFIDKINPFRGRSAKANLDNRRKEISDLEKRLAIAQDVVQTRDRERLLAIERSRNAVQEVDRLNTSLITLDMRRAFWELRFTAFVDQQQGKHDRKRMIESSRNLLKVLNPAMELLRRKLEIIVTQIAEQQSLHRAAIDPGDSSYRTAMVELLTVRERAYLSAASEVEEVRNLLLRWMEEEDVRFEGLSAGERARNWFGISTEFLRAAWTFELFAVEDTILVDGKTITNSRGVTVAKVVRALLIVILGYLLTALTTRFLMKAAIRRGHMDETSARIARKWVLSVTLVILLLLALDVVKIPLTAFAFLGGAIAIGAGFGMQTLLKNLISGVMLLMERPFKPRDIIEVGGIRGEVTDINVRSCTIRDVNGIETLVPNSTFLEQNVTNWTLSSQKVRYTLNIGVSYGTPVRRVSELLLEVANRHKLVLDDPPPEVLLMDFADNALMFALYVWLEIGQGRRSGYVVLSDLRFMIDTSFSEKGITIPFPQRDVHLDASSPLPVRVILTEAPASDEKKPVT